LTVEHNVDVSPENELIPRFWHSYNEVSRVYFQKFLMKITLMLTGSTHLFYNQQTPLPAVSSYALRC